MFDFLKTRYLAKPGYRPAMIIGEERRGRKKVLWYLVELPQFESRHFFHQRWVRATKNHQVIYGRKALLRYLREQKGQERKSARKRFFEWITNPLKRAQK
jgi:hypothetical protein